MTQEQIFFVMRFHGHMIDVYENESNEKSLPYYSIWYSFNGLARWWLNKMSAIL